MAQRVNLGQTGLPVRKKTFSAKTESLTPVPNYIFSLNPITGKLTKVVNNIAVLKADKDETDPTGGGGAATGRIPITVNGVTVYIPYY